MKKVIGEITLVNARCDLDLSMWLQLVYIECNLPINVCSSPISATCISCSGCFAWKKQQKQKQNKKKPWVFWWHNTKDMKMDFFRLLEVENIGVFWWNDLTKTCNLEQMIDHYSWVTFSPLFSYLLWPFLSLKHVIPSIQVYNYCRKVSKRENIPLQ